MRNSTREQISDTARELMNGISESVGESYTDDLICHIEERIDDHMVLQMDQVYWAVCGQSRRPWSRSGLPGLPPEAGVIAVWEAGL